MAEISAATVAKLRAMTNVGMMQCKQALLETNGDVEAAVDILRKRGIATAAKKATREARKGSSRSTSCPAPGWASWWK